MRSRPDKIERRLLELGIAVQQLQQIEQEAYARVDKHFKSERGTRTDPATITNNVFAPTNNKKEKGERSPAGRDKIIMVDAALFAIREIMQEYPEALFYGQDVGRRLGGVFREAATLAEQFGDHRVFNTAIQEAYIIGSTVGMSAVGLKPIVEVQFADYIYPGFNQLVTEISKSCYLSMGKYPVQVVIRVPRWRLWRRRSLSQRLRGDNIAFHQRN
jgi:2-oxoisovalerate dehydrogenase E1 component